MRGASGSATRFLAAVGYLLALDVVRADVRVAAKARPMLCLLLWQWPPLGRYGRWIFAGLTLSLLGDVLLDVGPGLLHPGLGAFLLAHVVRPLPGSGYGIMRCYWAAQGCIAVSAREPRQSSASRACQAGAVGSSV